MRIVFVLPLMLIAAGALAAPPQNADQRPPASSIVGTQAPEADALVLARLMQPDAMMLDVADRAFATGAADIFRKDDFYVEADRKQPGLIDELVGELSAAFRAYGATTMPTVHRRYALLYMELFTPTERSELIGLFSAPVGKKLITAKMANLDLTPMVNEIVANPDAKMSTEQMTSLNRVSAKKAAATLTEADGQALLKLVRPETLAKMRAVSPRIMQLETDFANEEDPALDAVLDKAMKKFMKEKGLDS